MMNVDIVVLTHHDDKEIFNKTIDSIHKAIETTKDYFRLGDFIIIGEEVKGRGRARDVGWRKGKSDYVLFTDVGVTLSNNWLIEIHKAIISVGGDVWFGDSSKAGNPEYLLAKCSEIEYVEESERLASQGAYLIVRSTGTSNILFRRSILENVNGFDVNLPFCEDREIGYRIWKIGGKIYFVNNAKATNMHRIRLRDTLKKNWEKGLGVAYIKNKHINYPIGWKIYLLLPYSCVKRIFTWSFRYGWIGIFASFLYFFKKLTMLLGYIHGRITGMKSLTS